MSRTPVFVMVVSSVSYIAFFFFLLPYYCQAAAVDDNNNDISSSSSSSPPYACTTEALNFAASGGDPCPYANDGECDGPLGFCLANTDCVDCDPARAYDNLGCDVCTNVGGGVHCETDMGDSICSSPDVAAAFPNTCIDLNGTAYTTECEPKVCDFNNDPCFFQLDGVCDLGPGLCSFPSDCVDCSPCHAYRWDGCEACVNAGCLWCGKDALCLPAETPEIPPAFGSRALTCRGSDDFVNTCSSSSSSSAMDDLPPFTNDGGSSPILYDTMEWVYNMINVKPVWAEGITGNGIGVRINDNGVDSTHPDLASNFDVESSCSNNYLPYNGTYSEDNKSHGTSCAALVGANNGRSNNGSCSVGIAPGVTLSSCRIVSASGDGFDTNVVVDNNDFGYLYEKHDKIDISSNSFHGQDSCTTKQSSRRRRRRELQGSICPFVQMNAFTPCHPFSLCSVDGNDWSDPSTLSEQCQRQIVKYCSDGINYEADLPACMAYLDLSTECQYNALNEEMRMALIQGVTEGRGGKGIIYVMAASDSHSLGSDVNHEGSLNSRFTISVGAVGKDGIHASYSATGAALFVTGPGGDEDYYTNIVTALAGGGCYDASVGTSYATPIVSGVIALMLEVNPNLSWRDVQGILATTSQKMMDKNSEGEDYSWTTNAAGVHHSYRYGFGVIDAYAAVTAAKDWTSYGTEQQILVESGAIHSIIPDFEGGSSVLSTVAVEASESFHIESVSVYLDISHSSRGDLEVALISPSGTESILHPGPRPENSQVSVDERWKLMTLRNWNENPTGDWNLRLVDKRSSGLEAYCVSNPDWSLNLGGEGAVATCDFLESALLCLSDGSEGPGYAEVRAAIPTFAQDFTDPLWIDANGVGPLDACCACGGGTTVSTTTPNVLKSWRMIVYGRDLVADLASSTPTPPSELFFNPIATPPPAAASPPTPSTSSSSSQGVKVGVVVVIIQLFGFFFIVAMIP